MKILMEEIGDIMYDVAIIGAGPAGLFSAYELITKNKNLKIVLLDRGNFAENRVCPMNVGKENAGKRNTGE